MNPTLLNKELKPRPDQTKPNQPEQKMTFKNEKLQKSNKLKQKILGHVTIS